MSKSKAPHVDRRRPVLEELERRLLLSADAQAALADPDLAEDAAVSEPAAKVALLESEAAATQNAVEARRELVIIDPGADDSQRLVDDLRAKSDSDRHLDVVVLDAERDGVEQISEILADYENLDALHIVSHGSSAAVRLGSTTLDADSLDAYASAVAGWSDALKLDADLLFYGCDLAEGGEGEAFVDSLSTLTGADVAASTDATGHALLGGDWELEYQAGQIETGVAFSAVAQMDWAATLVAPVATDDPGAHSALVSSLSPVSYWRLGETAGAPVDIGSAANDGTYQGVTLGQTGALNGDADTAARFDGAEHIEVAHSGDYLIDEGAVQLWFKADSTGSSQHLFSKDALGNTDGGHFSIYYRADGSLEWRLQSASADYIVTTSAVSAGAWHHVLATFGSDGMNLYVDGAVAASDAYTGGLGTSSGGTGNAEPLVIGASTQTSGGGVATPLEEFFTGEIDEVAIFGSQLTGEQAQDLYAGGVQYYTISEDTSLVVPAQEGVLINDSDFEGDSLTARIISGPSNGTLAVNVIGVANQANVTNHTANEASPAWSPDGSKIVFSSDRDGDSEIFVADADGSNVTQLTNNTSSDALPRWSPDGSKIAFVSQRDGDFEIYVMDADGSNPVNISSDAATDYDPQWSPDGSRILFRSNRDGDYEIFVVDADGSNMTQLTSASGADFDAKWSPDGSRIAYQSGGGDIYVMDADGSNQTALTSHAAGDYTPSWSPDGSKIAFASTRDGNYEIYEVDADGSNLTRLTFDSGQDQKPSWSPDGSKIVFESDRVGPADLYMIDPDGTDETALTTDGSWHTEASWSPDGTQLAYLDYSLGNMEVVVADLVSDGSFTYTPDADYAGAESFTYVANDGSSDSNVATVDITVNAINDAPVVHGWHDAAWDYRKVVTVDAAKVEGDVTDFPILITLNADADLAARALANGDDILFTAADGVTKLAHEIEGYDPVTGALTVWVKTDLSATTDTTLFLYYGNDLASNQQDPANVWDANYVGVWHLNNTPDGTAGEILDSTANNNHGTTEGAMDAADSVAAKIGKGLDFDELDDLIRMQDSPTLDSVSDAATFELWIWFDQAADGQTQIIMSSSNRYSGWDGYEWANQGTGEHFFYPDAMMPDTNYNQGPNPFTDQRWHHLAATMDFSTKEVEVYVDGVPMTWTTEGVPSSWSTLTSSDDWLWGGNPERTQRFFDGMMDEIRVSDVVRSQDWLKTSINNQSDPASFFSVSGEEPRNLALTSINEDETDPAGDTVTAILASGVFDRVTDADLGALEGIAVVGVDDTNGVWEYTTDGGGSWLPFGSPSSTSARLLAAEPGTSVRFVPDPDWNGTVSDGITFHAWDQTSGSNGGLVDLTTNGTGGSTSFSTGTARGSITVDPVNDPPVVDDQTLGPVAENSTFGTVAGNVAASDVDSGQSLSYAITAGNTGGAFAIDPGTGEITVATPGALNFEALPGFSLTVSVTDDHVPSLGDTATVTINLTDVDEAPVIADATFAVDENAANSTAVGTVPVAEPDANDSYTYAITAGDPGSAFAIDNAGNITVADGSQLNFETQPSYTLTVRVTDDDANSDLATITVNLNDLDEAPVIADATFAVDEGAANSTAVGTVPVAEPDANDSYTYAITAGDPGSAFAIDNAGNITVADGSQLNFESQASYTLTVRVTDDDANTETATITVNLNDLDEAPVIADATFALDENAANSTAVGTVPVAEPDANDTYTYAITAGDPGSAFAIDNAGNITVADGSQLNFESQASYTLTVRVTDDDANTDTATITVNLNDLDEAPVIADATFAVDENAANSTAVGTVPVTEPDANDSYTYAITAGDPGSAFAIDNAGNITVADGSQLNFESQPSYTLTVRVTDDDANSDLATITVNLNDLDEAPVIADATFAVDENAANSTAVGTVPVTEPDANDSYTYAITAGDPGSAFAIDNAGNITVADGSQLNFESQSSYTLTVRVTDDDANSDLATITVNLNDLDEAPVIADATFAVDEGAANSTAVGTVPVAEPDANDSYTYAITAGDPGSAFAIDNAGNITVADGSQLNFESQASYTLTVRVTDDDANSDLATITVNLNDLDEAPVIADATFAVDENAANSTAVGTVPVTEPDANDSYTYAITAGDPGSAFAIDNAGNITVADGSQLNFESQASYTLTVRVTDDDANTETATITVNLNDLDEAPVIADATFAVDEGAANSTAVGTVPVAEPDANDSYTYAITAGDPGSAFAIDNAGNITVADGSQLNFESQASYTLTVRVTDDDANTDTATITVNLNDLDEAPVIADATFALDENAANSTAVGTVPVAEPDANDSYTYAITAGDPGSAFAIDNAGNITVADGSQLNFESQPSYTLTVRVTDDDANSDLATITVNLNDLDEAPVIADATFALDENAANSTAVGTVPVAEPDANDSYTYAITAGDPGSAFAIDNAGNITVADGSQLNFESQPSYTLTVRVTDDDANTDTATITVNLNDLDEAPVIADATFAVDEGAANSTAVGTVPVTEPDANDSYTYAITAGDPGSAFAIDNAGNITVADGSQLNFESQPSYTLTVRVTDDDANSDLATITVNLNDLDEAPVIADATFAVDENAANSTAVGTVPVTEPDANDSYTYAITAGDPGSAFAIDNAGNITVADGSQLNFESQSSYTLTVRVTDDDANSDLATITVNLNDLDEAPVIADATFAVDEGAANSTAVGTVPVAEPDANDSYTYAITAGDPGSAFAIDNAGNITVADGSQLNFESQASYTLTVRVTDDDANTDTATITVNLNDLDEAPVIADATFAVDENAANSTAVGTVPVTEPDANDSYTYAITAGDPGSAFAIDNAGNITVADGSQLNFESQSSYTLTVRVTDDDANSDLATITVNLNDLDEAPVIADATFAVDEGAANSTAVGTVPVAEPDANDSYTYAITAGDPGSAFAIDNAGNITVADGSQLNFESQASYTLTVRVTDDDANTDTATITVNLNDLDEAPVIADATFAVDEGAANSTAVGTVPVAEPDANDSYTYAITAGDPGSAFAIDNAGNITVADGSQLNFESQPSYTLTVRVTDDDANSDLATITVNLNDLDEAPVIADATFALDENAANSTAVGTVPVAEPDANDSYTYAITAGDPGSAFAIDNAGNITVADGSQLNFESQPSYTLTVRVTDDDANSDLATITVNLNDLDEAPVIADATFAVDEGAANSTAVGTVPVAEPDANDSYTYAITAGDPGSAFAIDNAGNITVADGSQLNFESQPSYTLTVRVTDDDANSDLATITVNLNDLDEAPVIADATFAVDENAANSTAVGTVPVAEPDANDSYTYAITAGDPGSAFAIDNAGNITVADGSQLNFESQPSYTLTVRVTDDDANSDLATITVNLNDLDEAPVIADATFAVDENAANSTAVGTVPVAEPDANDTYTYAITAGDPGSAFAIDNAGNITVADGSQLNFESQASYTLTVRVTDDDANTDTATITVNLNDLDEAPVIADATFALDENAANSTAVGTVPVAEPDANDSYTYAITAGDPGSAFAIDNAGNITVADGSQLNFESQPSYTLTVEVQDDDANTETATITVNLNDLDEAPVIADATFAVDENAANSTAVGTVPVAEPDANDSYTYAITAGDPGSAFAIDNAGNITVADGSQLNFESQASYTLTVEVQDDDANTDTATITVNLNDLDEAPVIADATFAVDENAANSTAVGTVPVAEPDANDSYTYAITAGDPGSAFAIDNAGNITVADGSQLNFESQPSYTLTVRVTDDDANTDTATITVNLNDLDEAPVIADATFAVDEGAANSTAVGTVPVAEPDANDSYTYAITAGDPGSAFAIDNAGNITVADGSQLNFESQASYTLTVRVTDDDANTDTATITVNLNDLDEAPVIADATFALDENAANSTAVGTVPVAEPDANDSYTYAITAGDPGSAFAIDNAGNITVADGSQLNFESQPSYTLTVRVTDDDANSDLATITVNLNDLDEAPVIADATFAVDENAANSTAVGTVPVTEPDANDSYTYAITAGDPGTAFAIDNAGNITVADGSQLNFESQSSYTLTVRVTDDDANSDLATITVNLNDLDEAPVIADATFAVDENAANSTAVGTVPVAEPDANDSYTYAITAGDPGSAFAIDNAGNITVADGSQLNFESQSSYTLTVQVADDDASADTASITVNLNDLDEAPVIADATFAVDEGAVNGTAVGTVPVAEPDANDSYTYAITAGDPGTAFAIDNAGNITVADGSQLNFEAQSSYTLTVRVTDDDANSDLATITVNLNDLDEAPVIADATFAVDENAANSTAVGTVPVAEPDANDSYTYAITAGDPGSAFAIDNAGNITVADGSQLNFESQSSYTLTVQVADDDASADTASITVNLNDLDEAPVIADATFAVDEGAVNGTAVGTVPVAEPDANDSYTYAITAGDPGTAFAIDNAGNITVADGSQLNFEAQSSYTLTVQIQDDDTNTDTATITVNLNDLDGVPVINDATFSVDENVANSAAVGTVPVAEPDANDTYTYSITAGDPGTAFAIDDAGNITVADGSQLNFESQGSYTLTVEVQDDDGNADTATITVNLNDLDEAPVIADATFAVDENAANSTAVGTVPVAEPDANDTYTYAITAGDPGTAFAIDNAGNITVADGSQLNFESQSSYTLTVRVTDDDANSDLATITVNLNDLDEAPVIADATFAVDENAANSTAVGTVPVAEPDANDSYTYAITAGDPGSAFAIDNAGNITVADGSQLNFESQSSYTLTVRVTDDDANSDLATITVNLNDLDEAPVIADATFAVDENAANSTAVGTVPVAEPDANDSYTYAITAGDPGSAFAIDNAGNITVADGSQLNFESQSSYTLTVRVTDDDANSDLATITVNLNDLDEAPVIADATFAVDENAANSTAVGTVPVAEADANDSYTYAITAGDPGTAFAIDNAGNITVADGSQLNFESQASYTLSVRVTDDDTNSDLATITVNLNDLDEAPVIADATFSVDENAANSTAVGTVPVAEPDASDTYTYSITAGDPGTAFAIDDAGNITVADGSQLNFEAQSSYTLTVEVQDDDGNADTATITVNLNDLDEAPLIADATFAVDENAANSTAVGTVPVAEPDASDTYTYSITAGDPGTAFAIDDAGNITVADGSQLNFEAQASYTLTVQVTDDDANADTATITVNLNDLDESPVIADAVFSVDENAANSTAVGMVPVTEPDANDSYAYAITAGDPGTAFAIDNAGNITVADGSQLNFESQSSYTLTVRVTDDDANSDLATITVNLNDLDEAPVIADATFAVDENAANSTAVGTVPVAEPDANDSYTYAITAGDPGTAFAIDDAGNITVADGSQLNFEAQSSYTLTVEVQDDDGNADTATITVNLNDLDEAPVIADATFSVDENAANSTAVGTVPVAEADANDSYTYAITAGDPGTAFAIDNAGNITVADGSQLNFESQASYTLSVRVTDDDANSDLATITVNLNDLDEAPVITDATFAVDENAANSTAVGTVPVAEPDASDSYTYTITAGDPGTAFAIDNAGNITVADGSQLNFEAQSSYTLTVQIQDDDTNTDTATITVNLNDLDGVPVINDATFSVDENVANSAAVGTVPVAEPDANDTYTYSITAGDPGTAFAIDDAGNITVADGSQLNFESQGSYTLTVEVQDDDGNADTATITVNLNDLDEAPVIADATFAVDENAANSTAVGTVPVAEPDANDSYTYAITAGDPGSAFAIDNAGNITVADGSQLNFESQASYTLSVRVTDDDTNSDLATITVNLNDLDEAPVIADATFSVDENAANSTAVGTVPVAEPDASDTYTYSITAGDPGTAFAIDDAGNITVADGSQLNFEAQSSYTLTVEVQDDDGNADTATITVNLNDLDEAPLIADATFAVDENAANSTAVGAVPVTEPDANDSYTYSITAGDPGTAFAIDDAGSITVADGSQLNFESQSSYTLTVQVTDDDANSDLATITVNLNDLDEAPVIADATFAVDENAANSTAVGAVPVTEPDANDAYSYSITGGDPSGAFAVDNAGNITVADGSQLDFESQSSYTLTVEVQDDDTNTDTATITVNLNDLDESPVIADAVFSVDENAANSTAVGTVPVTEPDANDSYTYAITAGDPGTAFAIDNAGNITVADGSQLNFESQPTYTLTVQVADDDGNTDTATITVDLNDLDEVPAIADAIFSLDENAANGTAVGTVPVAEPDANDTYSYSITAGDPGSAFAVDNAGNLTVADGSQLDFESQSVYTLTVRVLDDDGSQDTATITVNLVDLNEAPVVNDQTLGPLAENSAVGTVAGTVAASDVDAGQSLSYAITAGNTGGAFVIDPGTGEITVATTGALDFENTPTFNLTVEVTDDGAPARSDTATIRIDLSDLNEAPMVADASFTIDENLAVGAVIGNMAASDVDAGQSLSYAISAGNTGGAFAIDPGTGDISVADSSMLNFEAIPSFALTVRVQDDGTGALTDTAAVTIDLRDGNDIPAVADQAMSIGEFSLNGTSVGSVAASDEDSGDSLTFSITGGNTGGAFAIDPATGEITVANNGALDPAVSPSFDLTIEVRDSGGSTDTAQVSIALEALESSNIDLGDEGDDSGDEDSEDPIEDLVMDPPVDSIFEPEEVSEPAPEETRPEVPLERVTLSSKGVRHDDLVVGGSSTRPEDSSSVAAVVEQSSDARPIAAEGQEAYRLTVLREQAMWEALDSLGDQISDDAERKEAESERTRSRIERAALALSTGILAIVARASSLTAMALSSLPVWQRVDPLSVLALSARERKKREKELRDAEELEDRSGGLGRLLEGQPELEDDLGSELDEEEILERKRQQSQDDAGAPASSRPSSERQ